MELEGANRILSNFVKNQIMDILVRSHSGLRWVVLLLLIVAIGNAAMKLKSSEYSKNDRMINLMTMIFLHVQLLLGLILYFTSGKVTFSEGWMKIPLFRFFGMEHLLGMLVAITLLTIGRKKAEKKELPAQKHKTILVWYLIGLVLILAFIPWPFRNFGAEWF